MGMLYTKEYYAHVQIVEKITQLQKKGTAIYRLALKQETAESGGRCDSHSFLV